MVAARPHIFAHSVPHRVDPLSALYPAIEPYHLGRLAVDARHDLYFEQSGNPNGKPVVFLHGGPGGGTDPKHRRFFDPNHYRIILFDQRGCGQSEPFASLEDNTTWHLVDDIEALRVHLGVDRWQVFGGSWGSTLGVAYAEAHPSRVSELVLRGIFMFTDREAEWFYGRGTRVLFPDAWDAFIAVIPPAERGDLIAAYYARLTGEDPHVASRGRARVEPVGEHRRLARRRRVDARPLRRPELHPRLLPHRVPLLPPPRLPGPRATAAHGHREDPPHPDDHRPRPLRRHLPARERLAPAQVPAAVGARHRRRRRPLGLRARHRRRPAGRHRPPPLSTCPKGQASHNGHMKVSSPAAARAAHSMRSTPQ
nr:prolyl aminopeptidase [Nannocystis sp.]